MTYEEKIQNDLSAVYHETGKRPKEIRMNKATFDVFKMQMLEKLLYAGLELNKDTKDDAFFMGIPIAIDNSIPYGQFDYSMTHKHPHCLHFLSETEALADEAARHLQGKVHDYEILRTVLHSYFVRAQAINSVKPEECTVSTPQ